MTERLSGETLLKRDVLGRVRVPQAKRVAILDEFERSGMSGLAFAAHIGVKYPTFASWIQKRRRERGEYPLERKKVRAEVKPVEFLEAVVSCQEPEACEGVRVEAPGGFKVYVKHSGDISLAANLLRALKD